MNRDIQPGYSGALLEALQDGPLRTGDLDLAVLGSLWLPSIMADLFPFDVGPTKAPYADDLAGPIRAGLVIWRIDFNSDVWYALRRDIWFPRLRGWRLKP